MYIYSHVTSCNLVSLVGYYYNNGDVDNKKPNQPGNQPIQLVCYFNRAPLFPYILYTTMYKFIDPLFSALIFYLSSRVKTIFLV